MEVTQTSKLFVQISRLRYHNGEPKIIREVEVEVAPFAQGGYHNIDDAKYDMWSPAPDQKLGDSVIVISWAKPVDQSAPIWPHVTPQAATQPHDDALLNSVPGSPPQAPSGLVTVMKYLDVFIKIGGAISEAHPYAQVAWGLLTNTYKILQAQLERDDKIQQLWDTIVDTLDFMKLTEPFKVIQGVEKTVQAIMKQIYSCALFLKQYEGQGFLARALKSTISTSADGAVQEFIDSFVEMKAFIEEKTNIDSWKMVRTLKGGVAQFATMFNGLQEVAEDRRLAALHGAQLIAIQWDPDHTCLPGTREKILDELFEWVHTGTETIFWLSGAPGTGKSSVANSFASKLDALGRLAASFLFNNDTVITESEAGYLFGNLAHQLALYDPQIRTAVLSAMHSYGTGAGMSLRLQAKRFIVDVMGNTPLVGPTVLVIDALDESRNDSEDGQDSARETLVQAIASEFPSLPPSVKVLITSRNKGKVARLMSTCSSVQHKDMDAIESTKDDVLKYIQHRMLQIQRIHGGLPTGWPGLDKESEILDYAHECFLSAEEACTAIETSDDPRVKVIELLEKSE